MAGALFRTKSIDRLLIDVAGSGETTLKRTLGPGALVALGIGAIIGAGLFVRTAAAIAERSGPSVTLAFIVAGVGCAFAGLCYAEFASMIPIAGSAYTYSYATMGELVAWIIGWDLILEYAVGAATVAIAWSEYFNKVLEYVGLHIPYEWCHSPLEASPDGVHGIINIPAIIILALLTALLIRGTRESATVNTVIVITKVTIVLLVIGIGWQFINPANHTPFVPAPTTYTTPQGVVHPYGGVMGILGAAGVVFFAFIGFDAVSTAAQWSKLTVLQNGREIQRKEIAVNDPLVYGGIRFYQASYGSTGKLDQLTLTATPSAGLAGSREINLSLGQTLMLDSETSVQLAEFIPDYVVVDGYVYARSSEAAGPAFPPDRDFPKPQGQDKE